MKKSSHFFHWASWSAPILLAGLALGASPPAGSASVAGSAAPSASVAPPVLPTISGANIPTEPSRAPTPAEWSAAAPVRINRGNQGSCSASVLREWLRLRCPTWVGGGLVAGDPKGVTISALGDPFSGAESATGPQNHAVTTLILPLRRGEARVFSFLQLAEEYNSSAVAEGGALSVVWRTGRVDPVLVMTWLPTPKLQ